jgi:hypothetical protein
MLILSLSLAGVLRGVAPGVLRVTSLWGVNPDAGKPIYKHECIIQLETDSAKLAKFQFHIKPKISLNE